MSERYSRLFTLPEDLYSVGSPVVIAAGTLLKDNQTGKVIAQLKLRSISDKNIKAVKVKLKLYDTAGNPIGCPVDYSYLDLNAARDAEFGQKTPVPVVEAESRSYKASIMEVVFEDQSVWTADMEYWQPLAKPQPLSIEDPELRKQYQLTYGANAKYDPKEERDLWYCTCGALNHLDENCHSCGNSLYELQTVDMEKLTAEKDTRLAEIARKAAEEKAAAEAQKKKTAKVLAIVIPAVCAVVAIILLATKVIIPNSKYNNAVKLMDAGSYEEAIVAFEAMDGYKDSVQKIADCEQGIVDREIAILEERYNEAAALLEAEKFEEAISAFMALGDFKDSAEMVIEAKNASKYAEAAALLNSGDVDGAIAAFEALEDYRDSAERAGELHYAIAENYLTGGNKAKAAMAFGRAVGYKDAWERSSALWADIAQRDIMSGDIMAVRNDGTVVAADLCLNDVSRWTDIVAISYTGWIGEYYEWHDALGLRSDGTVVWTTTESPDSEYYRDMSAVTTWTNIVDIAVGGGHVFGLCADGTVVVSGGDSDHYCCGQCKAAAWKDIVDISAGQYHVVGLRSNGTVVAAGDDYGGGMDVGTWRDIVAISTEMWETAGLRSDGTVVVAGNDRLMEQVSKWRNITDIRYGYSSNIHGSVYFIVGLQKNGTVVTTAKAKDPRADRGRQDVNSWRNIVAIHVGDVHTYGLCADGTIVATEYINLGRSGHRNECDLGGLVDIMLPN